MNQYADIPVFLRRKRRKERSVLFWAVLIFALCVLGWAINQAVPTLPAHADTPVHDNAWYCAHLQNYTNGNDPMITKICKQYERP